MPPATDQECHTNNTQAAVMLSDVVYITTETVDDRQHTSDGSDIFWPTLYCKPLDIQYEHSCQRC